MMGELHKELIRNSPKDIVFRFSATRGCGSILLSPLYLLSFILKISYLKLRNRTLLVHINLASYGSTWRKIILAWAARILCVPYVIHLHGAVYHDFYRSIPTFLQRRIQSFFRGAGTIIVLGQVWRRFVAHEILGSDEKILVLPNATSIIESRIQNSDILSSQSSILFLGRLSDRKGVFDLVDSFKLIKSLTSWKAILAGDGDVEKVRRMIDQYGLDEQVVVSGWVGSEAVQALLAESSILVLPSYNENLPMSVIEAMAAGLAIVTTPVGAIEDIIVNGETGLLVEPGDVDGLATALKCLILDPSLRRKLGDNAKCFHREHLEIVGYTKQLVDIWRSVLT